MECQRISGETSAAPQSDFVRPFNCPACNKKASTWLAFLLR